ncbi:MAG: hypothetical protein Rubg2KO_00520 [Rubricoccaceae bacterium]
MAASLRFFLLLALVASSTAPAWAQLGVTGGANFSDLGDARAADFDQSTGWHVGIYGQAKVAILGVRASVLYMDAGDAQLICNDIFDDCGLSSVVATAPIDLVSVPVDLQLRLPLGVGALYVAGGPDFRFPIEDGRPVFDARQVNVAASGAAGVELANVFLELRYARDVTSYARDLGADTVTDYELNTVMLRAGIGL